MCLCVVLDVDINECLYGSHNCQSVCENIPGSFLCRCTEGFHLREDNSTCAPGI